MRTSFVSEFASAAKEGPRLFFAPLMTVLRAGHKALHSGWGRYARAKRTKQDIQNSCEGR
jgi:hypothetical protein